MSKSYHKLNTKIPGNQILRFNKSRINKTRKFVFCVGKINSCRIFGIGDGGFFRFLWLIHEILNLSIFSLWSTMDK
ncbi:hypothetical protein ACS0TY_025363 [Phlomoides rotata]